MAGWADAILGSSNPFAQFSDNNSIFLASLGAGLGSGQNISAGLSNAAQAMPSGVQAQNAYNQVQYDRAIGQRTYAMQMAQRQATADAMVSAGYSQQVADAVKNGADPAMFTKVNQNGEFGTTFDFQHGPGAGAAAPPVPQGAGSFWNGASPALPGSASTSAAPSSPPAGTSAPSGWGIPAPDPAVRAQRVAYGSAAGADVANTQQSIQKLQDLATNAKFFGDKLINDKEGLDQTFGFVGGSLDLGGFHIGLPQQLSPFGAMPGTAKANFNVNLDAIKGEVASEGIKAMQQPGLRLTGQEVASAKNALAAISTATDMPHFVQAVKDFQAITARAVQNAQKIAAGTYNYQQPPATAASPSGSQPLPSGTTKSGLPFSVVQ